MKKNTMSNGRISFVPFKALFFISVFTFFTVQDVNGQDCAPDTEAPTASNLPTNISIPCLSDKPAPVDPTFDDNCDNNLDLFFSEIIPPGGAGCELTDSGPGAAPGIWSVLLRDPTGSNPIPGYTDKWLLDPTYPANGFEDFGDGTGRLTGKVVADNNPDQWFLIDVYVEDKMDWPTWSTTLTTDGSTFRTAKDDAGHAAAGGNLWTGWDFFVINPNDARLIGGGDLAGTWLELEPAPSNLFFGFQIGQAANDREPGFGLSSWFTYTGFINDNGNVTSFSGLGDFNMLLDCPLTPSNICGDYIIERSWAAVDDAGNATLVNQTVYVEPESAPIFSGDCPPDISITCDDPVPAAEVLTAVRSNCNNDPIAVDFEEVVNGDPLCPTSIVRTWSSEFCQPAQCVQTIIFVDECECTLDGDVIKPVLNIPNDNSIECDEPVPAPTWEVSDNCDNDVEVIVDDEIFPGSCPQEYIIARTFTATDDCGNSVSDTQIISVVDTTPPTVTGQDFIISCNTDINGLPAPTGIDNCDNDVTIILDQVITTKGECSYNFTLERHWLGIDDCGNVGNYVQYIDVSDTDPPVFNYGPTNEVVPCHDIPEPVSVLAYDYCESQYVPVYFNENIIPGECEDEYTIVRSWYTIDECGNENSLTRTFNVTDNLDPYWTYVPWDMYIECDDEIPEPNATAEDLCDEDVTITVDETTEDGECYGEQTITRVYTATDNCGNSITTTQHIYVLDVTPPYISVYDPIVYVPIGGDLPGWNSYYVWDNCDPDPYVVISDDGQPINCVENEILRTYTAFDDCGNSASVTQLIYVKFEDEIAPVAKCHNINVYLNEFGYACIDVEDIDGAFEFGPEGYGLYPSYDNCEIQDMWLDQYCFYCYQAGTSVPVTLYVEDFSKNVSTCTAYVTVHDNYDPVLDCKDEITVELNSDGLAFVGWEDLLYSYPYDNCGIADINVTPGIYNATSLYEEGLCSTVTVTDVNGNVSSCCVDVYVTSGVPLCELPYFVNPPYGTYEDYSLYYLHLNWDEYLNANACKILGNKVTKAWDYSLTVGNINTPGAPTQKNIWMGNLSPATEYRWKIRCGCSNNPFVWSPYNDYQYFTTPSQSYYDDNGIEVDHRNHAFGNDDSMTELDIYPNPNNGDFIINTNLSVYNIEIIDVTGKLVFAKQNVNQSNFQIELPDLAPGMYQLSVFNENAIQTEKILIREL